MAIVPAAAQTLAILTYLGRQAGPSPAAAIARDLGLPRSSVYHLLETMAADGYVVHYPEDRRYGLGVAAYELGSGYLRQDPLQRLGRVPMATLVDRTGHNAHLAVLRGVEVVYVIEERARGRPSLVTEVGVRLPADVTASGRAMLSRLPAAVLRALYPPGHLRDVLADARRDGYAREEGEVTDGFSSVAAPVLDRLGHPVAAVALTWATGSRADTAPAAVRATAAQLTRRLGGPA